MLIRPVPRRSMAVLEKSVWGGERPLWAPLGHTPRSRTKTGMVSRDTINAMVSRATRTYSVRTVQVVLGNRQRARFLAKIAFNSRYKVKHINMLDGIARVDIAGVASSILATPTIIFNGLA